VKTGITRIYLFALIGGLALDAQAQVKMARPAQKIDVPETRTADTNAGPAEAAQSSRHLNEALSARAAVRKLTLSQALALPNLETATNADGQTISVDDLRKKAFAPTEIYVVRTSAEKPKRIEVSGRTVPANFAESVRSAIATGTSPGGAINRSAVFSCEDNGPVITRIRGEVTPGAVISVLGFCLSETAGQLRMFGDYPGNASELKVHHWSDTKIVTQVPDNISGVGDIPVRFEVVTANRKAAKPFTANFLARMELVDVSSYWRKLTCKSHQNNDGRLVCNENGLDYLRWVETGAIAGLGALGTTYEGLAIPEREEWKISLNKQCSLAAYGTGAGRGSLDQISGWENGPPHESTVVAQGTAHRWMDKSFWGDTLFWGLSYTLTASAYCPAGVSPQP
jgi:hypothetical protein